MKTMQQKIEELENQIAVRQLPRPEGRGLNGDVRRKS
jgi:hypothetical protein